MSKSTEILSLTQMIRQYIHDEALVYLEGILVNRLPIAMVHEIIRAKRRNLRVVSAPNGIAVDQLIGAGCVHEIEFYFLGFMTNQGFASMQQFRTAVETGQIVVKESMGYAICMALRAGAYGIPFMPLPDFRGSDLLQIRTDYRLMKSPYNSKEAVITVPALQPDVLLLHAHVADERGNILLNEPWTDFTLTTAQAAHRVLVTVEEIVPFGTLKASEITIPHFLVDAVAQVSFGAAPTALNRCYEVDFTHIAVYQKAAQTHDDFHQYLRQYILGCDSHEAFLKKTGFPPTWSTRSQGNASLEGNLP